MLGLYLHVPFCSSICNYCNFNRGLFDAGLKERYVDALEREILQAGRGEPVDTIYFGGGTPSLLEPAGDRPSDPGLPRRRSGSNRDAEITLETNPETSSVQRMDGFREAGVNRVSFGVQSFRDAELKRLGRLHSADRAGRSGLARPGTAGFDNISLDLMMWLPGAVDARLVGERRPADRRRPGPRVPVSARAVSRTRRSRRTWPAAAGRWRRTRTRPRCI